jgi:glycogen operon protein
MRNAFFTGKPVPGRDIPDIAWHGIRLNEPPWHDGAAQFLAFTIAGLSVSEEDLHVMLNMASAGIDAPLPPIPGKDWCPVVDTSDSVTTGILPNEHQQPLSTLVWRTQPHTVAIFQGRAATAFCDAASELRSARRSDPTQAVT